MYENYNRSFHQDIDGNYIILLVGKEGGKYYKNQATLHILPNNFLKCFMSYICINFFNKLSSNSKHRLNFPLMSQVLLISDVNPSFYLGLPTDHALNTLWPFFPLELCLSISSQSVRLLPKLTPTHSDFSLLGEKVIIIFYIFITLELSTWDCQLHVVRSQRTNIISFHLSIPKST